MVTRIIETSYRYTSFSKREGRAKNRSLYSSDQSKISKNMETKESILEKLSLFQDINTIFLDFLDHNVVVNVLRYLNHQLNEKLPLQIECLKIRSDVFQRLKNTLFPKVRKLVLLHVLPPVDETLRITKAQFPQLSDVQDFTTSFVRVIIDDNIQLAYFCMTHQKINNQLPVHSLRELNICNFGAIEFVNTLITELLSPHVRPPLEKLSLPIRYIDSSSDNHTNGNNCTPPEFIKAILYKFYFLKYVEFIQFSNTAPKYDFTPFFTANQFPNLILFKYLDEIYNSYIYISDPDSVTELELYTEILCCIHFTNILPLSKLRKLEIEGSTNHVATFLRTIGKPLWTWAPNLQELRILISEDDKDTIQDIEVIGDKLFHGFVDSEKFPLLRELLIESNRISVKITNKISLRELQIISFNALLSMVQVRDCPVLQSLKISADHAITTVFEHLPSLQKIVYTNRRNTIHEWSAIDTNNIRSLTVELDEKDSYKEIVKLISNSPFLHHLDIECQFEPVRMKNFLDCLFCHQLDCLRELKLSGTFEGIYINNQPQLEKLILLVSNSQKVSFQNITTAQLEVPPFQIRNLPKLKMLKIQFLPFLQENYIPFGIYDLPVCTNVSISPCVHLLVNNRCSKILQENMLVIAHH